MIDTAIVIVNYNTRDELADCLRSIAESRGPYTHRVIVVDNHSSDGSPEMVRREHPWVELVASQTNGGYPYANNVGLRAAGFGAGALVSETAPRYALLLNPDTVLPPDALAQMVAYMDLHPDVGAAGPKLVRQDGTLDRAWRPFTAGDRELSHRMINYWTNFMKNGDPNSEGLPRWDPYTSANPARMHFDL